MDLENIYIPLLEEHRELPDREIVLARFRTAFFERLERGGGGSAAPRDTLTSMEAAVDMVHDAADEPPRPDEMEEAPVSLFREDDGAPDGDSTGEDTGDLFGGLGFEDTPPEEDKRS